MAIKDFIQNGAKFDGDTYSIKYFGLSSNISSLQKGKNSVSASPSQFLKPGTEMIMEVLDSSGQQLKVFYPNTISPNNDFLINIIVGDNATGGRGEAYIRGVATKNPDTGETIPNGIPIIWYGIVDIKLEDDEITPTDPEDIILTEGKGSVSVEVTPLSIPYQEGAGTIHSSFSGTGTIRYYPVVTDSKYVSTISNKPDIQTGDLSGGVSKVSGGQSTTTKGSATKNEYPTIVSTEAEFTADMVGGIFTAQPDITTYIPPVLIPNIGSIPIFETTIIEVLNETTLKVDANFSHTVPGNAGFPQGVLIKEFLSTDYDIEYNKSQTTSNGQKVTGYAKMCFKNTATDNGKVKKVKVSAKPVGALGSPMELGEFDPIPPSKMVDANAYEYDPQKGLQNKSIGNVTSAGDIFTYFDKALYKIKNSSGGSTTIEYESIGGSPTTGQSSAKLTNAFTIAAPGVSGQVAVISVKDAYAGSASANTEYVLSFDAYCEGASPEMLLYISGVGLVESGASSNLGTLVGQVTGTNGQTQQGLSYVATAAADANSIKAYLVIKSGTWHIAGLDLSAGSSTNNSPNEFCVHVPLDNLPVNKIGEEYVLVADFIGENGKPIGLDIISQGLVLNEDATIDEDLVFNTLGSSPSLQSAISGSFTSISASFSTDITQISSSFSTRVTNNTTNITNNTNCINTVNNNFLVASASFSTRVTTNATNIQSNANSISVVSSNLSNLTNCVTNLSSSFLDTSASFSDRFDDLQTYIDSDISGSLIYSGSYNTGAIYLHRNVASDIVIDVPTDANISGSLICAGTYGSGCICLHRNDAPDIVISSLPVAQNALYCLRGSNILKIVGPASGPVTPYSAPSNPIGWVEMYANGSTNGTFCVCHIAPFAPSGGTGGSNAPNFAIKTITYDEAGHISAISCAAIPLSSANDASICIAAAGVLVGGGTFTTNQGANETITITHPSTPLSPITTCGAANCVVCRITWDSAGHVTGVNLKPDPAGGSTSVSTASPNGITVAANTPTPGNYQLNHGSGGPAVTFLVYPTGGPACWMTFDSCGHYRGLTPSIS